MPQSKNSCAIFASPGGGKRRDVYSVGKPSSTCTLMEPGVKPRRIISNFCSHGEESAYLPRSPWMCAPHRRFDLARKEFCVGKSLTSSLKSTFLATTLHAPRTPYRHRTQDTQQQAFNGEVSPRKFGQIRRPRSECAIQDVAISLSTLPNCGTPPLLLAHLA